MDMPQVTEGVRVRRVGLSLLQDRGRWGLQHIGVPPSGAWHTGRFEQVGALLEPSSQRKSGPIAIEILAGGCEFDVLRELRWAVVGQVRAALDGRPVPTGTVIWARVGSRISVDALGEGPAYLSFEGLVAAAVLGSCSFDSLSDLGPAPLRAGDVLHVGTVLDQSSAGLVGVGDFARNLPRVTGPIAVIAEPDSRGLLQVSWQVEATSRSGVRLRHHTAGHVDTARVCAAGTGVARPSDPVLPGVVQMTDAGLPIVLGPDAGVTGGYSVAATVITSHLDRLADVRPGEVIQFTAVTPEVALDLHRAREREVATSIVRAHALH